jgi:uncharacterized protein YraI
VSLQPGDILFNGRYRIQRQLGSGGFGSVYLAQDTLLREEVAIKELAPGLDGDQAALSRFLAEAKATMRLRHERIVGTHNVFSETGHYYIVMEYLAGDSLEARLKAGGPLPVEDAVHIAGDVAEGLAYAHQRGVVHCDLKPANILFTAEGHAKVADFGIAHIPAESLTRTWATPAGFAAGTVPYMSPEQADGVRDDPRVDVYALGAVLYRMLTGRPYLDFDTRETPAAQARNVGRIQTEAPVPPSTYNRHVAAWLDAVVLKALAKQPAERYSSAAALGEALCRREAPRVSASTASLPAAETVLIAKRPPAAPPASSVQRGGLPAWFWPGMGGALVLLVLVVAVTAWVSGRGAGRLPAATPAATLAQAVAGQGATPSPAPALFRATATPRATRAPTETVPSPTGTSSVRPTGTSMPPVIFAPTALATSTPVPQPMFTVRSAAVNVRVGPGTSYPVVGVAETGRSYPVAARSADGAWLRLAGAEERWVAASLVSTSGALSNLSVPPHLPATPTSAIAQTAPGTTAVPTRIASSGAGEGRIAFISERDNKTQINIIRPDGSGLQTIRDEWAWLASLSWSPDGRQIAYTKFTRNGDIHAMNADGANERFIGTGVDPSWSPDGTRMVYSADGKLNEKNASLGDIFVMNADGSNPVALTSSPNTSEGSPAWSPDGRRIVFESSGGRLWAMNLDGSNIVDLHVNSDHAAAAWSPDGKSLLFSAVRAPADNSEVYRLDLDSGEVRNLTQNGAKDWYAVWSPDGKQVAFVSSRDGPFEIYIMDSDGSHPRRVTSGSSIPDETVPGRNGYRPWNRLLSWVR